MPNSINFVLIVFRFLAVLGDLKGFEKESFASMGVKKFFGKKIKKIVNHTKTAHISKLYS